MSRRYLDELAFDVPHELALVAPRQRVGVDESLGEPDDPEFEALGDAKSVARAVGDFDAAAADIHDHRRRAGNINAVDRCEMDEARFFGARDDLGLDAGFALDSGQEFAAVFRLAYRAGRGREDFFDLMRFGQPAKT